MKNKEEVYSCLCLACGEVTEIPRRIYWSMHEFYKCPGCQQNVNINQASLLWLAKNKFIPALERQKQIADVAQLCGANSNDGREIKLDPNNIAPLILRIPVPNELSISAMISDMTPQIEMNIELYKLDRIDIVGEKRVAIYYKIENMKGEQS